EEEEARGGSRSHDRGFQIRQGSFKLNALRLPKPVARFVIMQVIFSCGCALLGILSVAFRCWMAYLCIPVIVGAMELLIGIIGYTAIKRPHKKILVKCYFIGCLIGSLAALGLVVFSIIGAATEQEYQCVLLPNVFAECNAVRGARFAIELTTVIIGIGEIVVSLVMFMIMCYGSCTRDPGEEQRARSREPRPNPADGIPENLELPSYDEHHNYPTSPFHEVSFINTISPGSFDPPSYTNIGLVNDELPAGFTPLAAAMGPSAIPAEPPPPYTLFAASLHSTPHVTRHVSQGALGGVQNTNPTPARGGPVPSGTPAATHPNVAGGPRSSSGSIASFAAPATTAGYERHPGWRDRTIHQSLRLSSDQSGGRDWTARSAHQRNYSADQPPQTESQSGVEEDPSILPPELYRDEIRRSGHRYSLSDPTMQSRQSRNRQRGPDDAESVERPVDRRTDDAASSVNEAGPREREVTVVSDSQLECSQESSAPSREISPRRRTTQPPPYDARHNVVRGPSNVSQRHDPEDNRLSENCQSAASRENCRRSQSDRRDRLDDSVPVGNRDMFLDDIHQSRTLPSNWRSELPVNVDTGRPVEEAIYESIPSPHASPAHGEVLSSPERYDLGHEFGSMTNARADDRERINSVVSRDPANSPGNRERDSPERWTSEWQSARRAPRERSGSRSWDESAGRHMGLPDVVGGRHSAREHSRQDTGDEVDGVRDSRSLPGRQPPPYGRRIPAYAPPPYRPRNRVGPSSSAQSTSLPNHARRKHLTSPPPPYQGHPPGSDDVESDDMVHRHQIRQETDARLNPGRAMREMNELSERVDLANSSRQHHGGHERTIASGDRDSNESRQIREAENHRIHTFRETPLSSASHSLPVASSSSSLAISPPSSKSTSSPPSAQHRSLPPSSSPSSSAAAAALSSSPRRKQLSATSHQLSSSSSSPNPSPNSSSISSSRQNEGHSSSHTNLGPSLRQSSSVPFHSRPREVSISSSSYQDGQYPKRPRPVPSQRPPTSIPHPPNSQHRSSPISAPQHPSTGHIPRPAKPPSSLPLHPLSLPGATPQPRSFHRDASNTSKGTKPEMAPPSRSEGKPAAEIHPFRTVHSTPVRPQKVLVATKALANALQKGHLSDLLEEYEETII
ncbi:uncharacterized protein, partial [Diadema antillarum]|uniref:uncharacterized protein n=1 Tax=Diadema antillarum TaxID=105358 RepID=UPI003A8B9ED2